MGSMHGKEWCFGHFDTEGMVSSSSFHSQTVGISMFCAGSNFCMCARNREEMLTWADKINPPSAILANVDLLDSHPQGITKDVGKALFLLAEPLC
jgi:hypothetical protein